MCVCWCVQMCVCVCVYRERWGHRQLPWATLPKTRSALHAACSTTSSRRAHPRASHTLPSTRAADLSTRWTIWCAVTPPPPTPPPGDAHRGPRTAWAAVLPLALYEMTLPVACPRLQACFTGGMFALGSSPSERPFEVGAEITRTCYEVRPRAAGPLGSKVSSACCVVSVCAVCVSRCTPCRTPSRLTPPR